MRERAPDMSVKVYGFKRIRAIEKLQFCDKHAVLPTGNAIHLEQARAGTQRAPNRLTCGASLYPVRWLT
jgi:hypothetical protein